MAARHDRDVWSIHPALEICRFLGRLRGKPSQKLFQWTSEDLGYPELLIHLGTVVGLMKLHTNYDEFKKQLDMIAPVYPATPGLFDDPSDWV